MSDPKEDPHLLDVEKASATGLKFDPAPEFTCIHCGRNLKALGVVFRNKVMWVTHEKCGCEGELEEERKAEEAASKAEADTHASRLMSCGIERRFLNAHISAPDAGLYLSNFADAAGQGLFIYGDVGRGKTSEASALAREFIDAGYSVVFTGVTEMLANIQNTYDGPASTSDAMTRFVGCDILVLDDFGKESSSAWTVNMLFQIINARYQAMKPTIYTSQYPLSDLRKRLASRGERETADAIASRITQTCKAIQLKGPDRRCLRAD